MLAGTAKPLQMPNKDLPRCITGKDGYKFVLRDLGQRISLKDYEPVKADIFPRGSGDHFPGGPKRYSPKKFKAAKEKIIEEAIADFKAGKFISSIIFAALCEQFGIKMSIYARMQCKYMNELDVSIRVIRHKNSRGVHVRNSFDKLFDTIGMLMAEIV